MGCALVGYDGLGDAAGAAPLATGDGAPSLAEQPDPADAAVAARRVEAGLGSEADAGPDASPEHYTDGGPSPTHDGGLGNPNGADATRPHDAGTLDNAGSDGAVQEDAASGPCIPGESVCDGSTLRQCSVDAIWQSSACPEPSDPCHQAACDPTAGCTVIAVADGSSCDDGNGCTQVDTCQAGACTPGAEDCSALAGSCTDGVCDPTTDTCVAVPFADGSDCRGIAGLCTDGVCSSSCDADNCVRNCDSGAACGWTCGATQSCTGVCSNGSTCDVNCSDASYCEFDCSSGSVCAVGCGDADTCLGSCAGGSTCAFTCAEDTNCGPIACSGGSMCAVDCTGSDSCAVQCDDGAACALTCSDASCTFTECAQPLDCGGGLVVCNRACP